MEMIKISCTELKVMMSPEDMKKYELDCDEEWDENRHHALRSILKEARQRTGFTSYGERLFVRMFPSRDGGCEMFVTKLSAKGTSDTDKRMLPSPSPLSDGVFIYSFSEFGNMISACRRLFEAGYRSESCAYRDEGRRGWYLVIGIKSPLAEEMGGSLMKNGTMYYINEYCTLLCFDAVSRLAEYA